MPQSTTTTQTQSRAARYRAKREAGIEWRPPSAPDDPILVRDLDISDHAVIGRFPDNLQRFIYAQIEQSEHLRPDDAEDTAQAMLTQMSGEELLRTEYELAIMTCKLGWIDPEVVDEVTDPERQVAVDDIAAQDRRDFMTWVFGRYAAEASELTTFPVPATRGDDAVPGEPGSAHGAEPADAPGGGGLLRADGV